MRVAVWSATTSDLRTSESRLRSIDVDVVGVGASSTAHTLVRSKPPANTDVTAEELALVVGQQVVRPRDGVAEGELSFRARRRPLQQPEAIGESVANLDRTHGRHARGRQLDSQRQPVEGLADLGHRGGGLLFPEPEVGTDGPRSLDEERDGIGGLASFDGERRDGEHHLAVERERLA